MRDSSFMQVMNRVHKLSPYSFGFCFSKRMMNSSVVKYVLVEGFIGFCLKDRHVEKRIVLKRDNRWKIGSSLNFLKDPLLCVGMLLSLFTPCYLQSSFLSFRVMSKKDTCVRSITKLLYDGILFVLKEQLGRSLVVEAWRPCFVNLIGSIRDEVSG